MRSLVFLAVMLGLVGPVGACESHPGVPHEAWLQWVEKLNQEKSATSASSPLSTEKKAEVQRPSERSSPRPSAGVIRLRQ